jgi:succinyl-diaminopimelate desuccinylase
MFEKYIDEAKDKIVCQTSRLIQIPSVYKESQDSSMPFGKEVNNALLYMLDLGEKLGFRTKNIDGYCGYIEFGEGDELVGIIGHLDVVPQGEGWTYEPFSGIVHEGKIYGRGAIDDKGPVVSALYAMKAVMDNSKVNKRVRLILGLNEESDWKCINYYKEHEELPTIGFSPDANFPCIYAEKGFLSTYIESDYSSYLNESIIIKNLDCKGNAINVVPKECECTLQIDTTKIDIDLLIDYIETAIERFEYDIKIKKLNEKEIKLISFGISAHAAHPNLGINAISRLLVVLQNIFSYYNISIGFLHLFDTYINTEINGKSLGLNIEDESGNLTLNVGEIHLEDNVIKLGLNIRVPINTTLGHVTNVLTQVANKYKNTTIKTVTSKVPMCVPKDSFLVTTLCSIFNEITGLNEEPVAIGGATYARAFDNCVSFGANMPNHEDMCHQTDEYISIENLIVASKIYAEAIYKLAQ